LLPRALECPTFITSGTLPVLHLSRADVDYGIFCGEWCIGRIYENRSGPKDLRWFWAFHAPSKPGSMRISNQVASLEAAKEEFETTWTAWKAWAKMEELP
jgi:hypothetical protein